MNIRSCRLIRFLNPQQRVRTCRWELPKNLRRPALIMDPRLTHALGESPPLHLLQPPSAPPPPLLPGWEEHFDSRTQLPYYYCVQTGKSKWERPKYPAQMTDILKATPTLTCPRCHVVFHEHAVYLRHIQENVHTAGRRCYRS